MSDGAATRDSSRERPTAGLAGSNASGDTSSAVRHSAQEPTLSAAKAAKPESPGLEAGEDVNLRSKILVVEDDDDLRDAVAACLARLGVEVDQARDGVE